MQGKVVKLASHKYEVLVDDEIIIVTVKGSLMFQNTKPKLGDNVKIEDSVITKIMTRKNLLKRPVVANVDQLLIVLSAVEPNLNFVLLDKLLTIALINYITPTIVITKMDKVLNKEQLQKSLKYYEQFFDVFYLSFVDMTMNLSIFANKLTVLAGESGVGKSTLLNTLTGSAKATQPVSKKHNKGRHTTSYTELVKFKGGLIADTPGFSKISFNEFNVKQIKEAFIDFKHFSLKCKFRECNHENEPSCNVKSNLKNVLTSRYDNYLLIINETKKEELWR